MNLSPDIPVMDLLPMFGPNTCSKVTEEESQRYVRELAGSHYENFSVLSSLLPARFRDDFAAVYAFCRWADDLGDETGADEAGRQKSLELLKWWREELTACFTGNVQHPVYKALLPVIEKHDLPAKPFHDLIDAFEQDQHKTRYQTLQEVRGYCEKSANPVGRLVLYITQPTPNITPEMLSCSDQICTGLQLANHWQDIRRDMEERDRIYLPLQECNVSEEQLKQWMKNRTGETEERFREILQPLVRAAEQDFREGSELLRMISRETRPVIELFLNGGREVLHAIIRRGYTTLWERPSISRSTKLKLVGRAWIHYRLGMLGFSSFSGSKR